MKTFVAFALLIAGISALPQQQPDFKNERLVTDAIASAIEDLSNDIVEAGLDPLYIQHDEGYYALPVPVIFSAEGMIEEFLFHGLSEIVINSISFSVWNYRLRFDISLPLVEATIGKADVEAIFFGEKYTALAAGRLAIKELNVVGEANASVGIISGISVRNIDLNFKIGAIESDLAVSVFGYDLSAPLNTFFGTTITATLAQFENEVNELLEIVALDVINANL